MKRVCDLVLFAFFLFVVAQPLTTPSAVGAENKLSPRTLVHLLDYLAGDYGGAVRNGKIIDLAEHKEHLELITSAVSMAREMPELKSHEDVQNEVTEVQVFIKSLASTETVATAAQKAKLHVIRITELSTSPDEWPQIARGRIVFEQMCSSCHGIQGKGDGPAAVALHPHPSNFFDANLMTTLTPFKIFNAVREGIPGTAMIANPAINDSDLWAVAFYTESLRHQWISEEEKQIYYDGPVKKLSLADVANLSDSELVAKIPGSEKDRKLAVAALRVHSTSEDPRNKTRLAKNLLLEAQREYELGHVKEAKQKTLSAYLDGIEPIEPKIKARDPKLLVEVEKNMALVRGAIEEGFTPAAVKVEIGNALKTVNIVEQTVTEASLSPALTFIMSFSILFREAFEAVLVIIALLGVLRATGTMGKAEKAAHWVHGGWIAAVGLGLIFWFFSGWLLQISGAGRELMEGLISLFAVVVLLFMGFWLHSKTEISRWNLFIKGRVHAALTQGSLFGLAIISFTAVAREALEVVLFLRTIWIEGASQPGQEQLLKSAMLGGVITAFALVFFLAWALLKFSSRVPIRKLFGYSSLIMALLSFILMGKALHSIQEAGKISITLVPFDLRSDILGFYPTLETIAGQALILIVIYTLWTVGKKPAGLKNPIPSQS